MIAFIVNILKGLLPGLIKDFSMWVAGAVSRYIERRKREKQTQEAAKKVENAKTPDEVRDAANDLP